MDVGGALRRAREEQGRTLGDLSRVTRVSIHILDAIERNDLRAIPSGPYARGFVRNYAAEVRLNPDEVVREYFSQWTEPVVPPPAPHTRQPMTVQGPNRWRVPVLVAVVGLVGLGLILAVSFTRSRRASDAVAAAGTTPPAAVGTAGATPKATAPLTPAAEITVALTATAPAWMRVDVDGTRAIYRTLQPGEREVLRAAREIRIRTGNAGGVIWQINDGAARPMGGAGEVRTARVTADGPH